jgi:hypothetical protein
MTDNINTDEITMAGIEYVVQPPPEEHTVMLGAGDVVTAKLPWGAEQKALGFPLGVWALVVARAGGAVELYDANRTKLLCALE